jgi:AcrR family transcriptional regulator
MVAAAQALYFQHGIAEVAMAEVAHYLRLPESRVLHWFPGKAPLVDAVVDAHAQAIYEELCQHHARSSTAVEELLALRNWASEEMKRSLVPFFQQLAADYPASQLRWQAHMAGFPVDHLRNNLRWGILQDLYRADLDVEAMTRHWFQQTRILRTDAALDRADMHRTLLEQFLGEIVTPAGALVARRLQEAHPFY